FDGDDVARRVAVVALPPRPQGQHPLAAEWLEPPADAPAVDGAADRVVGLGPPRLVGVERHGDDRAAFLVGGDGGAEALGAHGSYRGTPAAVAGGNRGRPEGAGWAGFG